MAGMVKGPAIFLAQFAGDAAPFNSFDAICDWAAALGYKGVQIPTWDGRLFDLAKAADVARPIATSCTGIAAEPRPRDHRAVDPSAGPARRGASRPMTRPSTPSRRRRCTATRRRGRNGRSSS